MEPSIWSTPVALLFSACADWAASTAKPDSPLEALNSSAKTP
jgi:hypothetical protein